MRNITPVWELRIGGARRLELLDYSPAVLIVRDRFILYVFTLAYRTFTKLQSRVNRSLATTSRHWLRSLPKQEVGIALFYDGREPASMELTLPKESAYMRYLWWCEMEGKELCEASRLEFREQERIRMRPDNQLFFEMPDSCQVEIVPIPDDPKRLWLSFLDEAGFVRINCDHYDLSEMQKSYR